MPVDETVFGFFAQINGALIVKAFLVLFLIFYAVFAFVLFRQIQLMGRTLPTPAVPLLRFAAIIHIGVALAVLLGVLGTF